MEKVGNVLSIPKDSSFTALETPNQNNFMFLGIDRKGPVRSTNKKASVENQMAEYRMSQIEKNSREPPDGAIQMSTLNKTLT